MDRTSAENREASFSIYIEGQKMSGTSNRKMERTN